MAAFRNIAAFNEAILTKQVWRLLHTEDSVVAKLLKAQYYLDCSLLDASLGPRPSFMWCSLWGARDVIQRGSRWLIGNGCEVNVWRD